MSRPRSEIDPSVTLARARELYLGCRSYSDAGEVVTFSRSAPTLDFSLVRRSYFATDFVRGATSRSPQEFLFESHRAREDDAAHWSRILVWMDESGPRSWASHRPEAGGATTSLGEMLADAADATMGASVLAASMLDVDGLEEKSLLRDDQGPTDTGTTDIGGSSFERVTFWPTDASRTRMWFAESTGALHHLEEAIWSLGSGPHGKQGAPTVMRATTFRPTFDGQSRALRPSEARRDLAEIGLLREGLFAGLKTDCPLRAPFSISESEEAELSMLTERRIELSVTAPSLRHLASAASAYCIWAERGRGPGSEELVGHGVGEGLVAQRLLGDLISEAAKLPHPEQEGTPGLDSSSGNGDYAPSADALAEVAARFQLGAWAKHTEGSTPSGSAPHLLRPMAPDLSKIWSDVREGLDAWERGAYDEALLLWHFSFTNRWGSRAYRILSELHGQLHG